MSSVVFFYALVQLGSLYPKMIVDYPHDLATAADMTACMTEVQQVWVAVKGDAIA